LEKYLLARGGRCKPAPLEAPKIQIPQNPVEPVGPCKEAFLMEKRMLEDLERLATLADKSGDDSLVDAIQTKFLRRATREVKDMGDLLQQVARVSKQPGLGIYILDKELRCHDGCIPWSACNDPECGIKKLKELFEETAEKELETVK
jgi:ferritin heavy chain